MIYLRDVDQFIQWANCPIKGVIRVNGQDAATKNHLKDEVDSMKCDHKDAYFPYNFLNYRDKRSLRSFPCVIMSGGNVIPPEGICEKYQIQHCCLPGSAT
jgi:hypothetical protein